MPLPKAKGSEGKPRTGMVLGGFALALDAVARVGTYGATKYEDDGWTRVDSGYFKYTDAMFRHLLAEGAPCERDKLRYDEETNLLHAAHTAWNALARLDLLLRGGVECETPDSQSGTPR